MASSSTGNLLVAFQLSGSTYLPGECQTQLNSLEDPDFYEGFSPGFFCEATNVGVEMKMGGSDAGKTGPGYGKFGAWNYNQKSDVSSFPIEFDEVVISRAFDAASPVLFQNCCLKTTFVRLIILRLRDVGGSIGPRPYIRMEFNEVLFTKVSWEDGESVTEKDAFRCRKFKSLYRETNYAGGMVADLQPATWDFDIALASEGQKS